MPSLLHNKVHQVDRTEIVEGLVDHSYYLEGWVNQDLRLSIEGREQANAVRRRALKGDRANVWKIPVR